MSACELGVFCRGCSFTSSVLPPRTSAVAAASTPVMPSSAASGFDFRCIAFLMSTQSHLTSRILRPHSSAVAERNVGDVPQRRGGRGVAIRLCHMICVSTLSELPLSHLEDPAAARERRRRDVQPRNVLQHRCGGSVVGRQVLQQLAVAAAAVHQGFDAAGDEQRSDERVALRCCRRRKQPNCSDKDLTGISSPPGPPGFWRRPRPAARP